MQHATRCTLALPICCIFSVMHTCGHCTCINFYPLALQITFYFSKHQKRTTQNFYYFSKHQKRTKQCFYYFSKQQQKTLSNIFISSLNSKKVESNIVISLNTKTCRTQYSYHFCKQPKAIFLLFL